MGQWGEYRFFFNYYHIQLLAAEFLICWHLPLRRRYRLPKAAAWLCYAGFPFLLQWLLNYDENLLETWYSLGFVAMMALSGVLLWFWFRFRSLKELAFYTMAACILQHLVYSTSQLACVTLGVSTEFPGQVLETVVLAGLYALFYLIFGRRLEPGDDVGVRSDVLVGFSMVSVFVVYFFSLWARLREPVTVSSSFFESLCCVLLLFLQFGLFERSKLQQQNAILQQILHLEQEQHRTSTENIELINRKCHDLKHQISALRYIDSRKEQEESIRQIERAVMIYDLSVKTGSDALDIVLAEKSLYCGEYNIRLSCIADGSRLNFMEDADVYALFGNAFDNAIESVCQLKDPEKRVISLHIYCRGSCLAIHMENYCDHPVAFEDDLPVTTKGDKDYHGYGTRSMRCLTEKYGGTMTLRTEGELFVLNILFPLNRS